MNAPLSFPSGQPPQGTRVLVTGGSGFIGRVVCQLLNELGVEVLNYDLNPWPNPAASIKTVIGDIEDTHSIEDVCINFGPTHLIHLAAFASVTARSRDAFSSIWNGTAQTAKAFAGAPHPERFVNISTQLVIKQGPQPDNLRHYDPYTPYGDAKAEAERLLDDAAWPFMVAHIRPANIWGPHHPSYPATIMRYIENGWYLHPATREPIVRTYGFVENCARQIVSVTFSSKVDKSDIYYAGDGAIDSGFFLDSMSSALRGRPVRRFPLEWLRILGEIGTLARSMGLPSPLDRERVMRMSTSYEVPLEAMHDVMMFDPIPFDASMRHTAEWYLHGANPVAK